MSRIGKSPIKVPSGVTVTIADNNEVTVKGPKGTLLEKIDRDFTVTLEGDILEIKRPTEQKRHKALHGLYRALMYNMVVGVSEGYVKELDII
ncbi:MAG TPA: 50S ribosomal protein L6, partial [Chitinophagales bacterium]|nr:50S ribosomal protein L6 [Chitinophagales bacterium]